MAIDKAKERLIVKFSAIKIRDMVSEDGRLRYVKAMDRVIEDIFGYRNFASRVKASRTESELTYVFRTFGWNNLAIFRISTLADALEDLLRIDTDIRRLKKRMNSDYGNPKKPGAKDEAKAYSKLKKLYTKTVRAICKEMHLSTKESRRYRDSYKAAKHLVDRDLDWDDDFFGYVDEEDDDYFFDSRAPRVDYFEEFLKNNRPRRKSTRYQRSFDPLLDEDDDDWDDDELDDPDKVLDDFLRDYSSRPSKRESRNNSTTDIALNSKLDAMIYGINQLTALIQSGQMQQNIAPKNQYLENPYIRIPDTRHVRRSDIPRPPGYSLVEHLGRMNTVNEQDEEPPELTREQLIDEINRSTRSVEPTTSQENITSEENTDTNTKEN